ncbi:box C/D snoRNA protein 1 isoform X2 [Sceloporus undulatus]|uniref:box C/D snoRNA protein 1 isoform X2 n=1 Tax=Sceloporus undulatus TaxID=8520 RepID=UPI001C4CCC0E|nr:box C/D snoRNA protein 1 isoform X2 [Sceloporus undulatus]
MAEEESQSSSSISNVPEGARRKMATRRCEICNTEEAKYRCPRCMKYSCSLACVKKHKTTLNCNGVREKTAFVSVNEFSDLNLLSDYRFLEDVARTADSAGRDDISHKPKSNKFVQFLKNRARRYNIHLQTLPIGFTKREQKFYWHLKLIFPHSHAKFTEKRVPDDKPLCDILKAYVDPQASDPVICQRLKIYTTSSQSDIKILMKVENRPHNSTRYEELDVNKGLRDNLRGKVVIEYPTLHVILQKFKTDMVLLGHSNEEANKSSKDLIKENSSEEEGEIRDSS